MSAWTGRYDSKTQRVENVELRVEGITHGKRNSSPFQKIQQLYFDVPSSQRKKKLLYIRSDEGLTLETSAF